MSNQNSNSSVKVPMGQKIAFGLGMLANQMFPAALGIFMVVLVEDLKFPAWMWGMLFFLPRIFDAFVDPIMGFITDNTRSVCHVIFSKSKNRWCLCRIDKERLRVGKEM